MSRYDFPGQQAAAAAHDSACACCDHKRRPTGPDDGDLYADGWTPGAYAHWFKTPAQPERVKTLAELDAESRAYWGIDA